MVQTLAKPHTGILPFILYFFIAYNFLSINIKLFIIIFRQFDNREKSCHYLSAICYPANKCEDYQLNFSNIWRLNWIPSATVSGDGPPLILRARTQNSIPMASNKSASKIGESA